MAITVIGRLREYAQEHPDAAAALLYLEELFKRAEWKNLLDVRKDRKDADPVTVNSGRTVTVFNVRGDYYRLIVHIHYDRQRIFIRDFLTHKEYTKGTWKETN
jgi:mRNA interferase HigB